MNIVVVSYNGTNINDGITYTSFIERSQAIGQAPVDAQYVSRAGAWPILSGKSFKSMTYVLKVDCSPGATQAGLLAKFEDLNQLFSNEDETPRELVVYDDDHASDRQYSIWCVPTGQPTYDNDGPIYTVKLALDDPVWQTTTDNTFEWSITTSTNTTDITVGGNADAYPTLTFAPAAATTDYAYSRYIQVLPRSNNPWVNRPINITATTDGNFDTAALVAGGKMLASGNDLRVFKDGFEVDRWINGINTTDTSVWVVDDMPPQRNMTLKIALGDTDVTAIELKYTNANKRAFSALPAEGRLIIDSGYGTTDTEEFTYTAKTQTNTRLFFTVGDRGVRNTTVIAHAIGANVRYLPYDYMLVYGNDAAEAPDVDDTYKPILSLASSNSSWTFTNFYDVTQLRAGIWQPDVISVSNPVLTNSGVFTSTNDAGDTDPATEMGFTAESYQALGVWKADSVKIEWRNYFPDLITSVSAISGDQYQTHATSPTFKMQSSTDGEVWANQFTVAAQTTDQYSTWTAWTKASTDTTIPANTSYLRFLLRGTINGNADKIAKYGVGGITVALTNFPRVMMRDENTNIKLDVTIANTTTGDSFRLIGHMENGKTIVIDTDPDFPTVKYRGKITNGAIQLSTTRAAWLRLVPGSNTLTYDSNLGAANNITLTVAWKDRLNAF